MATLEQPYRESKLFDLADKEKALRLYMDLMLSRTSRLFKWEGLPDSIPQYEVERRLQKNGHIGFFKFNGEMYALTGGLEGRNLSPYNLPTKYRIVNAPLNCNELYTINEDCVMVKNDSRMMGLVNLFRRYCTQLVENDLTLLLADINSRMPYIITADDEDGKLSAERMLSGVKDGHMGVLCTEEMFDSFNTLTYGGNVYGLSDLIEYEQYLKASMFNDIGLDANYNMKREAINSTEAQMNSDALIPFIDDMLRCRQEMCEKINEIFGTNISVSFDSIWEMKEEENEIALEQLESETEVMKEDTETETESEDNTDDKE